SSATPAFFQVAGLVPERSLPSGGGRDGSVARRPSTLLPEPGNTFGYCWMSVSTPTMLIRPLDTVRVSPPVAQLTLIVTTEDGPPTAVYTPSSAMPPFATFVLSPKRSVSRRSISVVTPFSTATRTQVTCAWPLAKGALSLASTMYELVPEVTWESTAVLVELIGAWSTFWSHPPAFPLFPSSPSFPWQTTEGLVSSSVSSTHALGVSSKCWL